MWCGILHYALTFVDFTLHGCVSVTSHWVAPPTIVPSTCAPIQYKNHQIVRRSDVWPWGSRQDILPWPSLWEFCCSCCCCCLRANFFIWKNSDKTAIRKPRDSPNQLSAICERCSLLFTSAWTTESLIWLHYIIRSRLKIKSELYGGFQALT